MVSLRVLKAFAHDVAHHAFAGLSGISPHMGRALRTAGFSTAFVELLDESPYPLGVSEEGHLRAGLEQVHEFAVSLLERQGFDRGDIRSVQLHVARADWDPTGYMLYTRVLVTDRNDRAYDSGWIGDPRGEEGAAGSRSTGAVQESNVSERQATQVDIRVLVSAYRQAAELHTQAMDIGDLRSATHAFDVLSSVGSELKRRGTQSQRALLPLLEDEHPGVRLWAATYALGFSAVESKSVLESLTALGGRVGLSAEIGLSEWEAARSRTTGDNE